MIGPNRETAIFIEGNIIVDDCKCAALQLNGRDTGIVVAQRGGYRHAPCFAVVIGFRAVDMVGRTAAQQTHQLAGLQLNNIAVNTAPAFGHLHTAPGLALIVGNLDNRHVAAQTATVQRTDKVVEDPTPVGKHLNLLAAERAGTGKHCLCGAPCAAPIAGDFAADLCRALHAVGIVFIRLFSRLCRVHQPNVPVGVLEQ